MFRAHARRVNQSFGLAEILYRETGSLDKYQRAILNVPHLEHGVLTSFLPNSFDCKTLGLTFL
ncbi:MAG: hypothetical protein FGM27_06815 [Candidatus Omnitrophica bacterium]|nr:hypothetical protein [Candidatus Omnitrophota bacterium]